jgi:DNA-binding NarL/FixJ family response regulator
VGHACSVSSEVRVLIVDDSVCFRQAARTLLERRGYAVAGEAGTASAALQAVRRMTVDAVLLDVRLPDGLGFDVCAALTASDRAPAVLLTSSEDFGDCFALLRGCRARGFVLKMQLGQCDLTNFWPQPPLSDDPQGREARLRRPWPSRP